MTVKQALQAVPGWVKVVTTIVIVSVAFGRDWIGLPGQTADNAVDIAATKVRVSDLERDMGEVRGQYRRMICLLAMPEDERVRLGDNPFALERECGR